MKAKKIVSLLLTLVMLMSMVIPFSVTAFAEEACEHVYVFSETIEPSCTGHGYDLYICTKCAAYEQRNMVEPIEHIDEDDDGKCDNCGEDLPMYFLKHLFNLLLNFLKMVLGID